MFDIPRNGFIKLSLFKAKPISDTSISAVINSHQKPCFTPVIKGKSTKSNENHDESFIFYFSSSDGDIDNTDIIANTVSIPSAKVCISTNTDGNQFKSSTKQSSHAMIKAKSIKLKHSNDKKSTRSTSHRQQSKKRKMSENDSATAISVCVYAVISCEYIIF